MDHIAIMNKSWKLIPKIISGEKSIESRWYQTKRAPWDKIKKGDRIYFKNSGEAISARAEVVGVKQFEFKQADDISAVLKKYGAKICLIDNDWKTWEKTPKYAILIDLVNPHIIKKPFQINKAGFGNAVAWIAINDILKIKI